MKKIKCVLAVIIIIGLFVSCKSKTIYVPVETVKVEYRDRLRIDSLIRYDSIFQDRYMKGDTIFQVKEKYKYVDKVRIVRDSVVKDSIIQVPYPVKGDPIPYVTGWQNFQIWCGRILLLLLMGFFGYRFIVKKFL